MPAITPKIALVEDDAKLASLVREFLESNGMSVAVEGRGDRAVERILDGQPDCVILDIALPGLDGLEVCKGLRPSYSGPILMLTARCDEVDEVVGLEVGADDYLRKPVRPRVLLARIKALLRRAGDSSTRLKCDTPNVIAIANLTIDAASRTATLGGERVELTTSEFDLLHYLANRVGQVVSRQELFKHIKEVPYDGLDRSIDVTITRLRKKLGDDGKQPRLIKSVRGAGYLLAPVP